MKSTLLYLAYGSNLHPIRLAERVTHARLIEVSRLPGHALRFHKRGRDGSGKCNAFFTGRPEDSIFGAVYEISEAGKQELDRYEGLGQGYEIKTLKAVVCGEEKEVFMYVATQDYIDNSLKPYTWYKEYVSLGVRCHAFPADYLNQVESIDPVKDMEQSRVLKNEKILRMMRV